MDGATETGGEGHLNVGTSDDRRRYCDLLHALAVATLERDLAGPVATAGRHLESNFLRRRWFLTLGRRKPDEGGGSQQNTRERT